MKKMETVKKEKYLPKVKNILTLPYTGYSCINPKSSYIFYTTAQFNLLENSIKSNCFVYDIEKDQSFKLVQSGSPSNLRWLDDNTIALIREDSLSKKRQIFIYEDKFGEGSRITDHSNSVQRFEVFGNGFIFLSTKEDKDKKFGTYKHVEEEIGNSALYYVDIEISKSIEENKHLYFPEETKKFPNAVLEITKLFNENFLIESFCVSPKFDSIFLTCRKKKEIHFSQEKVFYRIKLNADQVLQKLNNLKQENEKLETYSFIGEVTKIELPLAANIKCVSPDGKKLLIAFKERDSRELTQSDLWILDLANNENSLEDKNLKNSLFCLTNKFDQEPLRTQWTNTGIYVSYYNESSCELAKFNEEGIYEVLDLEGLSIERSFDVNVDGNISFSGQSAKFLEDIFLRKNTKNGPKIINVAKINAKYSNWDFGIVESIRWKSRDGTEIEGILHKPSNFDPQKKYPLLIHPHGGPHSISELSLASSLHRHTNPFKSLCNKGILVLQPNYRGSLGKGQWFKELLIDNIGVGDLWDIETGIDYLVKQGYIDESKIGSMGWSQGGFISAFVAMHSDKFTAVSVGAGVSSWRNYYIGSDMRDSMPLSGTPYSSKRMELYEKTAPISGIKKAKTPMLIQHGEKDQRTPVVNANELFRALKEKGVHTEFFVYPNYGHEISNARDCYAVLMQNYRWFCHYLLGEELELEKYEF